MIYYKKCFTLNCSRRKKNKWIIINDTNQYVKYPKYYSIVFHIYWYTGDKWKRVFDLHQKFHNFSLNILKKVSSYTFQNMTWLEMWIYHKITKYLYKNSLENYLTEEKQMK